MISLTLPGDDLTYQIDEQRINTGLMESDGAAVHESEAFGVAALWRPQY